MGIEYIYIFFFRGNTRFIHVSKIIFRLELEVILDYS